MKTISTTKQVYEILLSIQEYMNSVQKEWDVIDISNVILALAAKFNEILSKIDNKEFIITSSEDTNMQEFEINDDTQIILDEFINYFLSNKVEINYSDLILSMFTYVIKVKE